MKTTSSYCASTHSYAHANNCSLLILHINTQDLWLLLHVLHSGKEKMECNRKKVALYRCEQDSVWEGVTGLQCRLSAITNGTKQHKGVSEGRTRLSDVPLWLWRSDGIVGRRCAEPADAGNETLVMFSTEQRGGAVCGLGRAWPRDVSAIPLQGSLVRHLWGRCAVCVTFCAASQSCDAAAWHGLCNTR